MSIFPVDSFGDVTVCKVPKEGSEVYYIIQTEWNENNFRIVLLENGSAWTGIVSAEEVDEFCLLWDFKVEDYVRETRKALSTVGGASQFSYHIEGDKFVWKKHNDVKGNIKIKFGSVSLSEIPVPSTFENMMDIALGKVQMYQKQALELELEKKKLETEREILIKKLDQYAVEKANLEDNLYSKFLSVLNAKKEKIKSLKLEQLHPVSSSSHPEEMEPDVADDDEPVARKAKVLLPKRKPNSKEELTTAPTKPAPEPGTSKREAELETDDLWDYDGETQVDDSQLEDDLPATVRLPDTCLPKRVRQAKR